MRGRGLVRRLADLYRVPVGYGHRGMREAWRHPPGDKLRLTIGILTLAVALGAAVTAALG